MSDETKPYSPEGLCNRCGAKVVWASYVKKNGDKGRTPFDPDPVERGAYALMKRPDGRLYATFVPKGGDWPPGSLPRQMHFKSCPGATK